MFLYYQFFKIGYSKSYYFMYFIQFDSKIIKSLKTVKFDILKCHEEVIIDRKLSLVNYLKSLQPDIIVPSLIVCEKTNTIIDGHHRFHALKSLELESVPVTFINYETKYIKAYFDDRISKEQIIGASLEGRLLPPKSSKHIIYDDYTKKWFPINVLSSIYSY